MSNPKIKYGLIGFLVASVVILGLFTWVGNKVGDEFENVNTGIDPPPSPTPAPDPKPEPPEPVTTDPQKHDKNYAVVKVFFGTDRKLNNPLVPAESFLGERGQFSYGTSDVSIPRNHRMGMLEAPSIWRLEWREDPQKHVVLLAVDVLPQKDFFSLLTTKIGSTAEKKAFVFIHGYNVSFQDAARRTAQMSYDLAFDGVPIFYSWPSQGNLAGYTIDETNIEWTEPHLKQFLVDVAHTTKADAIYLIGHSMGNRALTKVVASLASADPALLSVFREIILTAPDIDADIFKNTIAPQLVGVGSVTLYASSNDKALALSKKYHGYRRAGDTGAVPVILRGMDTIDASKVSTDFLGHSYFADHSSVISDIYYLLRGIDVHKRHMLRPKETSAGVYWEFQPE